MRRYTLTAGAAALSILLAACGSPSTVAQTASTPTSAAATTPAAEAGTAAPVPGGIVISAFAYSGTLTDKKTHLFDTGNIAGKGGTGTFTAPSKPGSYPFGCTYHRHMEGTLIVQG